MALDRITDLPRRGLMRRKPNVITLADRARDAGQWELAAGLYRKALDRYPRNSGIWVQYGHALKESGELRDPDKLAQAESAYRKALSLNPGAADSHLQLGHVLKLQGKTEEAKASYLRAFALDPSIPYPLQELSGLGWSEAQMAGLKDLVGSNLPPASSSTSAANPRNDARRGLKELRLGSMRRKASVIDLADRARDARQWERAAQLYRKALDRNRRNPPIWVQFGHTLKESGELRDPDKLAQAEIAYRQALSLDPGVADTYVQLGHVLKLQGKTDEAAACYLRAYALDPSMPYPLQELGGLGWSETHLVELRGMLQKGESDLGCDCSKALVVTPQQVVQPVDPADDPQSYANWVRLYDTIDDDARKAITAAIREMPSQPLISVVMPVYNTPEPYLLAAIDSVRRQLYSNWELCIADDSSTAPRIRTVLEHYRTIDSRIKVCYRKVNGNISAASNSALSLAEGSFVALLDHDDMLPEHALYMVAVVLEAHPEVDLIYSDEDKIDTNGRRYSPYFKSDWNPDLMLSQNMFSHLGVYRRSLIERIGGFRAGYEGSQDYDLVLRAQSLTLPHRIQHIPHILYHWRAVPGSAALRTEEKAYAVDRARLAIADYLVEHGISAEVLPSRHPAWHRVRYILPEPTPRVTIVIPINGPVNPWHPCVEGLLQRTDYPDVEILIVAHRSREPESCAYFDNLRRDQRIKVLLYDEPYNYSAMNNFGAAGATGSVLCFIDNAIEPISRDWLREMVSHAVRSGIGAVGGLLYYPDDRIRHAGIVIGPVGGARDLHHGLTRGDFGYFGRAALTQNLSAVSGKCLVMPKEVFDRVGGFNEKHLHVPFNDVDLCLRIREAGYRIVWAPHAELYDHSDPNKTERTNREIGSMARFGNHVLDQDPYYNPNLGFNDSTSDATFLLAFPPRIERRWERSGGDRTHSRGGAETQDAKLISLSGLFDGVWYLENNEDVLAAGFDPLVHYLRFGAKEGREPHPLFDGVWYLATNPDVAADGVNPLVHYIRYGAAEGRAPHPSSVRATHPEVHVPDLFELRQLQPSAQVAVVLHLFDPDLWDEMREAIERILHPFDLFVSLVKGSSEHMRNLIKQSFPNARVFDFEDHGRDIGSFLVFLQSGVLFRYDLICKLHTKRSPHRQDGDAWRRTLINGVLGSSPLIDQILSNFRSDPDLGMVVANGNICRGDEYWVGNEKLLAELLPRIGISPDVRNRSFPAGSIFWIRSFLLRTLAGAGIQLKDFDPEPLKVDGGLGHAVERMFGLICEDAGMRVVEHGQLAQLTEQPPDSPSKVPLIAYYLPQFHPIPENDEWWGLGFTEWTNVTRAAPLFEGHRQPRLPSDLGFYDLRLPEVREAQAALAGRYGISAFCYYYYWFNGRRVLERPLNEVVATGKPDFPFMIFWANEPWTRNWDGENSEVLLPQTYEPGWATRFANDIAPLLLDQRYFHIDGKPMMLIYRIRHIPQAAAAMRELRLGLLAKGVPEVHIAAAWVWFADDGDLPADPSVFGVDAYFEFPPHKVAAQPLQPWPPRLNERFQGALFDYNRTVTASLAQLNEPMTGRRHRCVMTAFDNTARKASSQIYHGATPTNFRRWLRGTIEHERHQDGERVVFINAWNEWAEGSYIEPDRDFGRGWLEAVASAAEIGPADTRWEYSDSRRLSPESFDLRQIKIAMD